MKKAILIFFILCSCSFGWAQNNESTEAAKAKPSANSLSARAADQEARQIVVFPNPSNGIVHLTLAGFKGKRTELRIMNVIGNVVHREILSEAEDRYTKTIDLTKNANGLYYVKLQTEDYSEIRKIIIN